jgi:hypothetical protein
MIDEREREREMGGDVGVNSGGRGPGREGRGNETVAAVG